MDQKFINVIWVSYNENAIPRGYWDQGLLEDLFKQLNVNHYIGFDNFAAHSEGAVVIVNGRTHITHAEEINKDIAGLAWCLFIDTGDEEATFPWRDIKHPVMRVWMMLPRMTEHNDTHFKLPNGYRPETRETLKAIGMQERTIDYSFVGQVNHERREQCVQVAQQFHPMYPSAVIKGTAGFGQEALKYPAYMTVMAQSKIVLCPSGVESPDNFRLYEALEAGSLPVVDAMSTNFKTPGFWKYLFGNDIPFPIVDYWDAWPDMIPRLLSNHVELSNRCFAWWQLQKRKLKWQLIDDVRELSK